MLSYQVSGAIARLKIPDEGASVRAVELWKHTCCEAFVAPEGGGYDEFNFSPSTAWAAYQFDSYRTGMRDKEISSPQIEVGCDANNLALVAHVPAPETGRLGISAVIETIDGDISYWALAHAAGRADFHHPDSFAIDLRSL